MSPNQPPHKTCVFPAISCVCLSLSLSLWITPFLCQQLPATMYGSEQQNLVSLSFSSSSSSSLPQSLLVRRRSLRHRHGGVDSCGETADRRERHCPPKNVLFVLIPRRIANPVMGISCCLHSPHVADSKFGGTTLHRVLTKSSKYRVHVSQ